MVTLRSFSDRVLWTRGFHGVNMAAQALETVLPRNSIVFFLQIVFQPWGCGSSEHYMSRSDRMWLRMSHLKWGGQGQVRGPSVGFQTTAQLRTQTMIVSPSSWSFTDFFLAVVTDNYLASFCNHMRDSKEKWPKASHSWEPGEAMMINQWFKGLPQAGLWLKSSQRHVFHFQPAV